MKMTALIIAAILTSLDLFAQGTVLLNNRNISRHNACLGSDSLWGMLQGNGSNDTPPDRRLMSYMALL